MSDVPAFVYVTYIRTTPEKLWEALTSPDFKQQYWFGRRCESDWKAGSKHSLRAPDGSLDFDGEVLESDPPRTLAYSFHNSPSDPQAEREPPSRVTYRLEPVEDSVKLTVTHDQFPDGSKVRQGIGNGWPVILSALKSLLETGTPTAQPKNH
jgi:uncharacterized protein YndB with AHSA1/START domain